MNAQYEMERNWGKVQDYLTSLLAWQGFDGVTTEELTVAPGTEELFALLRIKGHAESGEYDTIIVDAAPTGETLRLLSLPDVMNWWMEKIFPSVRRMAKVMRPVARRVTSMPIAGDDLFESMGVLTQRLAAVRDLLTDPTQTSVRLVLNLERMVIREAERSLAYLSLFNYLVDAAIVNRVLPADAGASGGLYESLSNTQAKYARVVEESFAMLPRFAVPQFAQEIAGPEQLVQVADVLYGDRDPAVFFSTARPQRVEQEGADYVLVVSLPNIADEEVDLAQRGDELDIRVGWHKQHLMLPDMLARRTVAGAKLRDGALRVRFTT